MQIDKNTKSAINQTKLRDRPNDVDSRDGGDTFMIQIN